MTFMLDDRIAAGRELAQALSKYRKQPHVLVLALPRGGVPVAAEIARELHAPFDLMMVRKLTAPGYDQLAMGAIASGGIRVVNPQVVSALRVDEQAFVQVAEREESKLEQRMRTYRGERGRPAMAGERVILVDDGAATGATMRAAIAAVRAQRPEGVTVAVPVAPFDTLVQLRREADEVVCLASPEPFAAVGSWYRRFPQLTDEEVREFLRERWHDEALRRGAIAYAATPGEATPHGDARRFAVRPAHKADVTLRSRGVALAGTLTTSAAAHGLVVFVHGSGSNRFSSRNRQVAELLNETGLATLLFDILTPAEQRLDERTGELRFDIALLSRRLIGALEWISDQRSTGHLQVGLFGSSTGAAAAFYAAVARPQQVAAIVARGGRPDLALDTLGLVRAPTLLIVGGLDTAVIDLNNAAAAAMSCEHRLEIVAGATHLFEEPGTLDEVARLARVWFERHVKSTVSV